jgi:SAM-dependent methyltransferase
MIRINRPLNLAIDMGGACGGMLLGMKEEKMFKQGFVCDLPKVRNIAEKRIGESPFKTELRFIECNFLQNNFPQGADLITFAHVFHDWREKVVRKLIDKAYRALKTDGYILVVEYYLDEDRLGPYPACQQNYFVWLDSSGGKQYTGNEIAKWLAEAGFKNILVCSKFLNTSEGYILGTK